LNVAAQAQTTGDLVMRSSSDELQSGTSPPRDLELSTLEETSEETSEVQAERLTESQRLLYQCTLDSLQSNIKRSHSELLLAEALEPEKEKSQNAICLPTKHASRPFQQMWGLFEQVRLSAHMLEEYLRCIRGREMLKLWSQRAKKHRASRSYDLALEAFDKADQKLRGELDPAEATEAAQSLHEVFDVHMEGDSFCGSIEGKFAFREWVELVISSEHCQLPSEVQGRLEEGISGVQCCCGTWMQLVPKDKCYPAAMTVLCDLTGEKVLGDQVWHCPMGKDAPLHPHGFDIDPHNAEAHRCFSHGMRREAQIAARLEGVDCSEEERVELAETRAELCEQLLQPAEVSYRTQLAQTIEGGGDLKPPLEAYRQRLRSILATRDWQSKYEDRVAAATKAVERLEAGITLMNGLQFSSEDGKRSQITQLEEQFAGARLHSETETHLKQLTESSLIAKEMAGLREVDLEAAENRPTIESIATQILTGMLGSMPAEMRSSVTAGRLVDATFVPSKGIQLKWEITMGGMVNMNLEHTLRADARDIANARLGSSLATKHHQLREALSALEQRSTGTELQACVEHIECSGSEGMCVVCQCDMVAGEQGSRLRACGHVYHPECIDGWLLGCKRECPVCKTPLGTEEKPSETSRDVHARSLSGGTRVELRGLQSQAELNGRVGRVVQWAENRRRYRVILEGVEGQEESTVSIRPVNLLLMPRGQQRGEEVLGEERGTIDDQVLEVKEAAAAITLSTDPDIDDQSLEETEEIAVSNDTTMEGQLTEQEAKDIATAIALSMNPDDSPMDNQHEVFEEAEDVLSVELTNPSGRFCCSENQHAVFVETEAAPSVTDPSGRSCCWF